MARIFSGMAAIGFTLPYLPLYLGEKGLSDRAIGIVSTLAALSALAQYPVGLWSDRIGSREAVSGRALAIMAVSTVLLTSAHGVIWLAILVILFRRKRNLAARLSKVFPVPRPPPWPLRAAWERASGHFDSGNRSESSWSLSWEAGCRNRFGVGAILVPLAICPGSGRCCSLIDPRVARAKPRQGTIKTDRPGKLSAASD